MSTRRSLLCLSWDDQRHRVCRRHGIETVTVCDVVEWDDVGPHSVHPDVLLKVNSIFDLGAIVAELDRSGRLDTEFGAILTSNEFALPNAAALRKLLGVAGDDVPTSVRFRDKHLQKRRVAGSGIPTAAVMLIDDIEEAPSFDEWKHWPAVLKPVAGGGASSTHRCANPEEAQAFLAAHRDAGSTSGLGTLERKFLLESFVEGHEWHLDGCVSHGEVVVLSVGAYLVSPINIHDAGVPSTRILDPERERWAFQLARPFTDRALGSLGLQHGLFHMEVFHDEERGTLTFGECAARCPGALVPEATHCKRGIDFIEWEVLTALGERPEERCGSFQNREVAFTFLPCRPGILLSAPTEAEVRAQEGVVYCSDIPPVGSQTSAMSDSSLVRLAQAIVTAEDVPTLLARMRSVVAWSESRTVIVRPGASARELWSATQR